MPESLASALNLEVKPPRPDDPIIEYFRTLDAALHETLREERAPLVLAGVEYLWPLYRAANTYPHLTEGGVAGNPHGLRPDELHEKAWKLVEPYFARPEREARATAPSAESQRWCRRQVRGVSARCSSR
jgi:release factor family 3